MKIVITGGTRGIGFAMAKQFLLSGNSVVISGTSPDSVEAAITELNSLKLFGCKCLVENFDEVENLFNYAKNKMGEVDIWINNAGINQPRKFFGEMENTEYKRVVDVNIIGLMNGTNVAFSQMQKQDRGFIYNMEGLGSDGRIMNGSIIYGTTKRAVRYFTLGVAKEAADTGVCIGRISPGMVLTDFILKDIDEDNHKNIQAKKIFNILADRPETVATFLCKEILKNTKNNSYSAWLTTPKIISRFLFAFRRKNKFFKVS